MDYEKLKEVIAKQIKENGRGEITGPVLQMVLMAMVDSLGEVYPQTYTDEQKAQARANIDALSDYDGEITKEKLSLEVQAILNDVANKQNITDATLATQAKTIVGAINELFNGGVKNNSIATEKLKDQAVEYAKLSASIRSTIDMVGMNVKVLPEGTDLLSSNLEEGIWIVDCSKMKNVPNGFSKSSGLAILIVSRTAGRLLMFGNDQSSGFYPIVAGRELTSTSWAYSSPTLGDAISNINISLGKKLDNTSILTDTEINNIWDNN